MGAPDTATVTVNASANKHAINPNIYGGAWFATSDLEAPIVRSIASAGITPAIITGSRMHGTWMQIGILRHMEAQNPSDCGRTALSTTNIQDTYAANVGAKPIITIPMVPYVAMDSLVWRQDLVLFR